MNSSAPDELIDHILARYHEVHRAQLPALVELARQVEAAHARAPKGLAQALRTMQDDLLAHLRKEEVVLFPMLRAGGNAFVSQPIHVMRGEHASHSRALERLARLTDGMTTPPDADEVWRALYVGLAQFRDDLAEHIRLENDVLFPQFEAA